MEGDCVEDMQVLLTCNYWCAIEKQLERYREAIKWEKKFIGETEFSLMEDVTVIVGFSPARGFIAAARLQRRSAPIASIVFLREDWNRFIAEIEKYGTSESDDQFTTEIRITEGTLRFRQRGDSNLTVSYADIDEQLFVEFVLTKDDIRDILLKYSVLVTYKLNILDNMEFANYINKVLLSLNTSDPYKLECYLDSVKAHCCNNPDEYKYLVMEYLYGNKKYIL